MGNVPVKGQARVNVRARGQAPAGDRFNCPKQEDRLDRYRRGSDRPERETDRGSDHLVPDHQDIDHLDRGLRVTDLRVIVHLVPATCRTTAPVLGEIVQTGAGAGTIIRTTGGGGQLLAL